MTFASRLLAAAAVLLAFPAAAFNHVQTIPPLPRGPFAVACSNVAQDTTRIAPGTTASNYWEGLTINGVDHYITEILANPDATVHFEVPVPNNGSLYPGHAGGNVTFVAIVCYPTSRTNTDADYVLPETGDKIPHMQLAGAAPQLISDSEYVQTLGGAPTSGAPRKLPVIVFSHGLTGSPISQGYVQVMVELAAQGFMVAAPFHGDGRFSRVRVNDFSDFTYLLRDFDHVVEMQLMRPLSLKSMTDTLLASGYAAGVDATRIGGFGASLGGEAMALLAGARITSTLGLHCEDAVPHDPRLRAIATYVPFAGWSFLPAFCQGQTGADSVNRPFLAISGTADTTAPIGLMQTALERFQQSRYLVQLIDGQHELRPEDVGDVFTWTITFLRAYMDIPESVDPSKAGSAMARFIRMNSVVGGRDDSVIVDTHIPFAHAQAPFVDGPEEAVAKEFYNTQLGHFFMAASPGEINGILAGAAGPSWEETGQSFKVWSAIPSDTLAFAVPVCRFYGVPAGGPNSHFFTASAPECELVKRNGGWYYEGIGFYIRPVAGDGQCPDNYLAVNRAYNNGYLRNDSNHRFTTSDSEIRGMTHLGWSVEGTVMCARP